MANDQFEKGVIGLLTSKQGFFYGSLILMMKRVPMKMERGAMGVGFHEGQVKVFYDEEWLSKMSVKQLMFCLEHECLHLALEHINRMGDRDPLMWNIAADLAVNGYIMENPGVCEKPYEIVAPGEGTFKDMPKGKTAEWYYDQIDSVTPQYKVTMNADGSITVENKKTGQKQTIKPNSHEDWESMKKGDESLHRELVKAMIKEAYSEAKQCGNTPGSSVSQLIEEMLKKSRLNWKALLRRYCAASILSQEHKSTWKRTSRRFNDDYPGVTHTRQPKIYFAIDTSGSMSDEDITDCVSELQALKRIYNATITVIECDMVIHRTYDLTKFKKIDMNFKGRGGTAFTPVFDHLKDKKCDVLIYATDLCGDNPTKPRFQTIWITPPTTPKEMKEPFGLRISIEKS